MDFLLQCLIQISTLLAENKIFSQINLEFSFFWSIFPFFSFFLFMTHLCKKNCVKRSAQQHFKKISIIAAEICLIKGRPTLNTFVEVPTVPVISFT